MIKLTPIEPNFVNLSSSALRCCLEVVPVKVAVVGSRSLAHLQVDFILPYIPEDATEIVSGGARGVDSLGELAAKELGLKFTCFLPDYHNFGKIAPLIRNEKIVDYADYVLAFWDTKSRGTRNTILHCIKKQKPFRVIPIC